MDDDESWPSDLYDAVNDACQKLPDGWQIVLTLERGSGTIELYDPDGDAVDLPVFGEESLAEEIADAIKYAQALQDTN